MTTFRTLDDPPVTFRDPGLEDEYRTNGFVVLPLLDADEVVGLRRLHADRIARDDDPALAIDFDRPDRGPMALVRAEVRPLIDSRLDRWFLDHRSVFATFVCKRPGVGSNMSLHEDRSWVDERHHRTGTMWIPLVDVGPGRANGGIEIVPRSHRLARTWSGSCTPNLVKPYEAWLSERLVTLEIPSGSALYCDSRTLHASEPNRSDAARLALALTIAPRRVPLLHVVGAGTTRRTIHTVDEDFYVTHGPWVAKEAMPDGYPVLEEVHECGLLEPDLLAEVFGERPGPAAPVVPGDLGPTPDGGWAPLPRRLDVPPGPHRLVEVPPGGRRALDGSSVVEVIACAPVGAGVVAGDAAANFMPGELYASTGPASIWNEGPGTLVFSVHTSE